MVIDFHTHIFPPVIRESREKFFPSEPAFELLYSSSKSRLVGAGQLLEAMDENALDKSVVFGFPSKKPETVKRNNEYVMEGGARYPDRLGGRGCFEPSGSHAAEETRRCLAGGLAGIGELAFYESGLEAEAITRLAPVMEICRQHHALVLIHTNEPVGHSYPGKTLNTLAQIYNLIGQFADNTIVLAHWGGGIFFFNLLKKEVRQKFKNVFFDTAASPYLYAPAIYKTAVEIVGTEKILFGSDYPLLAPQRYFKEMDAGGLSEADKKAICGGNAAALLKHLKN
jgi:predicted TIM-barrel fold metal-dependent hydrolase